VKGEGVYLGASGEIAMDPTVTQIEVSCESCGAKVVLDPLLRTARCPYCDSPSVVDRQATTDRPDPVFVIGFAVDRKQATRRMRKWIGRKTLAPSRLKGKAADRVTGIYLPTFLYSATSATAYSATIGEDYYTTEISRDSKGRTRVRRTRKTEHCNLSGLHADYVGDVVVTASQGITNQELEAIEPFDLGGLRRYTPAMVSGWISEEPSLSREACLQLGRSESTSVVGRLLHQFMPGDSHLDLRHTTTLHDESLDLALLPVWVFAIRYDERKPPIRILVNGQTGKVSGKIPTSWAKVLKIAAAVFGVLSLAVLIALLVGLVQ
jgi:DNA-directed RNA polymerase subunit RPC12/RpoP